MLKPKKLNKRHRKRVLRVFGFRRGNLGPRVSIMRLNSYGKHSDAAYDYVSGASWARLMRALPGFPAVHYNINWE